MRDRSVVTVAALIARNQTADLPAYIKLALDSGVTPSELSGMVGLREPIQVRAELG
jgi:4-carboxymuconolactone decarboxylase